MECCLNDFYILSLKWVQTPFLPCGEGWAGIPFLLDPNFPPLEPWTDASPTLMPHHRGLYNLSLDPQRPKQTHNKVTVSLAPGLVWQQYIFSTASGSPIQVLTMPSVAWIQWLNENWYFQADKPFVPTPDNRSHYRTSLPTSCVRIPSSCISTVFPMV